MSGRGRAWLLALAALALSGCDRIYHLIHGPGFDTARFEAALDPAIGGPNTCVVIFDTRGGAELYRYGDHAVCNRPLAPCETFQAPMALIGLDEGVIAPGVVWPWDGSPQPSDIWRRPADLASAFQLSPPWWWRKLALAIGPVRFGRRLSAFGYGQGRAIGDPGAFWLGPGSGGGLFISGNNQAQFLRRLYLGQLPVSARSAQTVEGLMIEDRSGGTTLSGLTGSCSSIADNSRSVGWWAGRIRSPGRDVVFAISVEGQGALPGREIRTRATPIFQQVGLLPS